MTPAGCLEKRRPAANADGLPAFSRQPHATICHIVSVFRQCSFNTTGWDSMVFHPAVSIPESVTASRLYEEASG